MARPQTHSPPSPLQTTGSAGTDRRPRWPDLRPTVHRLLFKLLDLLIRTDGPDGQASDPQSTVSSSNYWICWCGPTAQMARPQTHSPPSPLQTTGSAGADRRPRWPGLRPTVHRLLFKLLDLLVRIDGPDGQASDPQSTVPSSDYWICWCGPTAQMARPQTHSPPSPLQTLSLIHI